MAEPEVVDSLVAIEQAGPDGRNRGRERRETSPRRREAALTPDSVELAVTVFVESFVVSSVTESDTGRVNALLKEAVSSAASRVTGRTSAGNKETLSLEAHRHRRRSLGAGSPPSLL